MKLIIDIDEKVFQSVKETEITQTTNFERVSLYHAVKNGIALNEHTGGERMINISKDEIKDRMFFVREGDNLRPIAVVRVSDLLAKEKVTKEEVIKELEILKYDCTLKRTEKILDYAIKAVKDADIKEYNFMPKCLTCKHYDANYRDTCLNPNGSCRVFEDDGYEPKHEGCE